MASFMPKLASANKARITFKTDPKPVSVERAYGETKTIEEFDCIVTISNEAWIEAGRPSEIYVDLNMG